ncbi:MAG: 4Fe-4S dicluster domain-containing protein [Hyphomicrobiales bacterium]|nr:4Fe-4S dicluster domain-containing protein [Hyphomicrobiales bacterium]
MKRAALTAGRLATRPAAPELKDIAGSLAATGLAHRGAFHPTADHGIPDLAPGRPAATLVLVGNTGPGMWRSFTAACDPTVDLLDDWSRRTLEAVAAERDAVALFPFQHPPLPFQRWARLADACHTSPLGILIHPDHGLWHAYRGALIFDTRLALPAPDQRPSPCESCETKPCLSTCPVAAFSPDGYDIAACVRHVAAPRGRDCMERSCRARRACPVGKASRYRDAQALFHMTAFLRGRIEAGVLNAPA